MGPAFEVFNKRSSSAEDGRFLICRAVMSEQRHPDGRTGCDDNDSRSDDYGDQANI
ncbi:MAG: hypothetical protein JRF07_03215 [Deltaproteobacteria bacterium]|nr:hypothetical protein [Deltaproteobacteria bacterium]